MCLIIVRSAEHIAKLQVLSWINWRLCDCLLFGFDDSYEYTITQQLNSLFLIYVHTKTSSRYDGTLCLQLHLAQE
jgi:hypothetical protein